MSYPYVVFFDELFLNIEEKYFLFKMIIYVECFFFRALQGLILTSLFLDFRFSIDCMEFHRNFYHSQVEIINTSCVVRSLNGYLIFINIVNYFLGRSDVA
jgi:hypothetical protein